MAWRRATSTWRFAGFSETKPLSASTVSRLKEKWQGEYEEWLARPLDELEVPYLWVDGVYVKAGLEKDKAAVLVAVAGLSDGRKIVLTLEAGHRESEASWSSLLRRLKKRGLRSPRLVNGDGHLGIWAAMRNVFPEAVEQRCWNHYADLRIMPTPDLELPRAAARVTLRSA